MNKAQPKEKKYVSLDDPRYSKLLFFACFIIYAASYVGRINYSAALAAIISEGLFTKAAAGIIGSVFFFTYGGCQVLWGFLGDRLSPFKMILTGTFFAALANLTISFCHSYIAMAVVWGLNGAAHSMLWSPILRLFSSVICKEQRAKACLNLSLSLPTGTVAAYLIATVIIKYAQWRYVFTAASFILFGALSFFIFVLLKIKGHLTYSDAPLSEMKTPASKALHGGLWSVFLVSGLLFAIIPTMLHGLIKEGISVWVPTMLTETYGTSASYAIFITVFLPLFNATGAYLVSPVYKGIMKKNELSTAALCVGAAIVPLIALTWMSEMPPVISVILLATVTTIMHTFNYMLITLVPIRFARCGKTATVTGILNASAYAGCALSTYGFGLIADRLGWRDTIFIWLGIALFIAMICLALSKKWKRFSDSMEKETACERL